MFYVVLYGDNNLKSDLQFFRFEGVIAFIIVAVVDSLHEHLSIIDLIGQRDFQQVFDLYIFDGAALHRQQIILLVDFAPIDDHSQFLFQHQVEPDTCCSAIALAEWVGHIHFHIFLFENGINLVFIKEPYINTETYKSAVNAEVPLVNDDVDDILKGINSYLKKLATKQIRLAFEQAEKEVEDLHKRTAEGIQTARLNGKQIGQRQGAKLNVKKKVPAKELIFKHSRDFKGTLKDTEVMKLAGLSRNTYYKYKKELTIEYGMK